MKEGNSNILQALSDFVKEYDAFPADPASLCEQQDFDETDFYAHFDSIESLKQYFWEQLIRDTIDVLETDENYPGYSVRERLLAFYYTHMEVIAPHRSFVKNCFLKNRNPLLPVFLKSYRSVFEEYINGLIQHGRSTGEVANRWILTNHYFAGFWSQLLFILRFWVKDSSDLSEKTDAAIEKAVNLSLELIGPGVIDSIFDLGKFLLQNRK